MTLKSTISGKIIVSGRVRIRAKIKCTQFQRNWYDCSNKREVQNLSKPFSTFTFLRRARSFFFADYRLFSQILNWSTRALDYPCIIAVDYPSTRAVDYPSTRAVDYPSTREVDYPSTRAFNYPSTRAVNYPSTREVYYPSTREVDCPSTPEVNYPSTRVGTRYNINDRDKKHVSKRKRWHRKSG